ncbi:MAG: hypothetical protein KKC14_02525 [Alphaproteobacteria bacterium]|nr:hypothetical protein [Alphaproteobacteria bacterium]
MNSKLSLSASRLTPQEYAQVWWAIIWRTSLFGFIAGALLGGVAGFILSLLGYGRFGTLAGAIMGGIGNFVVSFFVVREVLSKRFRGFELTVLRSPENLG